MKTCKQCAREFIEHEPAFGDERDEFCSEACIEDRYDDLTDRAMQHMIDQYWEG